MYVRRISKLTPTWITAKNIRFSFSPFKKINTSTKREHIFIKLTSPNRQTMQRIVKNWLPIIYHRNIIHPFFHFNPLQPNSRITGSSFRFASDNKTTTKITPIQNKKKWNSHRTELQYSIFHCSHVNAANKNGGENWYEETFWTNNINLPMKVFSLFSTYLLSLFML